MGQMNFMQLDSIETLTQALQLRARSAPGQTALVFIHDDGREEVITAAEFHTQTAQFAQALETAGVGSEDLVVLVLQHSKELLFAFWGALYLGAIGSIFPFLTEKLDPGIYTSRVKELITHSHAKAVITFPEFRQNMESLLANTDCAVLSAGDVIERASSDLAKREWPRFSAEKTAFLQHSSGTTGLQKGVALSHRAVLNQIISYTKAIELNQADVIVSWLPLYHDMGLIAGFVMPLVAGIPLILMSPFKWVRDPKILLQAIHRFRGTLCWLPNFAYNHMARVLRRRDLEGLDLGSMRAFINCSEPVYAQSHEVFLHRLAPYGVNEQMLSTCYAMAENTFAVTQNKPGLAARVDWVNRRELQELRLAIPAEPATAASTSLVSCGPPIEGTQVQVANEQGDLLPERQVGEIILKSECMLSGYYRRPDLTSEAIRSGWYFTGDMGYLAEGELYITGRKKDLIIVGGKNIYPQDLEAIANQIPQLIPGRSVAFGIYEPSLGSEQIVMVCEFDAEDGSGASKKAADMKAIELDLRQRIVQETEIALSDIRLVPKRWLIKTSSGKISRAANREKYIQEWLQNSASDSDTLQIGGKKH